VGDSLPAKLGLGLPGVVGTYLGLLGLLGLWGYCWGDCGVTVGEARETAGILEFLGLQVGDYGWVLRSSTASTAPGGGGGGYTVRLPPATSNRTIWVKCPSLIPVSSLTTLL
jgi:hypothetical protein